MLEHGFVDRIVERSEMKSVLARILHMHDRTKEKQRRKKTGETEKIESTTQEDTMPKQVRSKGGISAWERVLLSRKTDRPVGTDYVNMLFSEFYGISWRSGFLETILQWQEELQCSGTFRSR